MEGGIEFVLMQENELIEDACWRRSPCFSGKLACR